MSSVSVHEEVVKAVPEHFKSKQFYLILGAIVLASIVVVQIASLWFAKPKRRSCVATALVVDGIATHLEQTPDRVIPCDGLRRLLVESPPKMFDAPELARLVIGEFDVAVGLEEISKKIIEDHCFEGSMKYGDLAKALREELRDRCGS